MDSDRSVPTTSRRLATRVLVTLTVGAAEAALGTWWAAVLLARSRGGLPGFGNALRGASVDLAPGAAGSLGSAVGVGSGGTADLGPVLGFDTRSGRLLGTLLGTRGAGTAHLARQLHGDAAVALVAAVALAALALLVSPARCRTILRLVGSAGTMAGLALLAVWPLAAAVAAWSGGSAHRAADAVVGAGEPVRPILITATAACLAVAAATVEAGRRWRRRSLTDGDPSPARPANPTT